MLHPHPVPSCQKVPPAARKGKKKRDELIGEQVVSPPFPIPLRKESNTETSPTSSSSAAAPIVWPLNQEGKQPFFLGKINRPDACIDILDPASVQCLYLSGFFGKGSRSKNAPIYKIKRKRELQLRSAATGLVKHQQLQQQPGTSNQLMSSCSTRKTSYTRRSPVQTRHGPKKKQWNSLKQAFGGSLPDKASLVKKLFPTGASKANNNQIEQQEERSHATCSSSAAVTADADEESGTSESDAESTTSSWESDADPVIQSANNNRMTGASSHAPVSSASVSPDRPEILKLGLEEAYFLSYGLGVLSIVPDQTEDPFMNLDQLWSTYRRLFHPSDLMQFPVIYAAYHYFRSRGWVVKCGLKFACHFLLYKEGPPFNHSEHAVTVVRIRESDSNSMDADPHQEAQTFDPRLQLEPAIDWQHVTAMQRMSQGVRKKVILCHVIIGSDITDEDFARVSVIEKLQVHCSLIQRWKPRQGDTDECSE